MRSDLQRTMLRRKAQACNDPVQKVVMLRRVVEMAEDANDYPMFSAVLREYEMASTTCPWAEAQEPAPLARRV